MTDVTGLPAVARPLEAEANRTFEWFVRPAPVTRLLFAVTIVLTALNLIAQVAVFFLPDFMLRDWFVYRFDVNREANIPTAFSGVLLLLATVLLGVIAHLKRRSRDAFALHWRVLTFVMGYLFLDEVAQLHDSLSEPLVRVSHLGGVLKYAWVVPYALLVVGLLLGLWRFLAHLPPRTLRAFLVAGGIYVMGALGLEVVEAWVNAVAGRVTFAEMMVVSVEELLEMSGVVLFIGALIHYLNVTDLTLKFRADPLRTRRP
ncbi:hypothetical protein [Deinococcus yavapaiensis]|uniref:Uncharacterized protein n=1 Tax=Deinococcus yavapaiensis KR-236 TaxID=694435 RepID=A0A318S3J9_9DEIO|nr:hypothetical protein [Deinococcus yavapaiensis]PYE48991.1 hypothetical protein DES52_1258 [Deinococcus yavapaiensis KR-236]